MGHFKQHLFLGLVLLNFAFSCAWADEGFSVKSEELPVPVEKVWDNSALLYTSTGNHGAALFLKYVDGDKTRALFLTCEHNLVNIRNDSFLIYNGDIFRGIVRKRGDAWFQRKFQVVARDAKRDLAVLEVKLEKFVGSFEEPVFQTEIQKGERVWSIGAPDLAQAGRKGPAELTVLKISRLAWSVGDAIGLVRSRLTKDSPVVMMVGHTSDLVRGNSGGPLVNSNGQIVGINARVVTTNVKSYVLSKDSKMGEFGFAVPATTIYQFLLENKLITQQ